MSRERIDGTHVDDSLAALLDLLTGVRRLTVLTGAGCSTASGVPDYRDADGNWKQQQPMQYQEFASKPQARRRYWARSFSGWRNIARAEPNAAHRALAQLEASGPVDLVITQNVDGLHQRGGSVEVLDLHGRLDAVVCLDCGDRGARDAFQRRLADANPEWVAPRQTQRADGDVELADARYACFVVPACERCAGRLKPDVVFFGESVPRERVERALGAVRTSDALLVVGSSLMVFSGYRYARAAAESSLPLAAINLGRTRADELFDVKVQAECAAALPAVAAVLCGEKGAPSLARKEHH